eukprot:991518-Pyramimonas_sp.AAC.2
MAPRSTHMVTGLGYGPNSGAGGHQREHPRHGGQAGGGRDGARAPRSASVAMAAAAAHRLWRHGAAERQRAERGEPGGAHRAEGQAERARRPAARTSQGRHVGRVGGARQDARRHPGENIYVSGVLSAPLPLLAQEDP